jgi:hypothetical protein
MNVQLSPGSTDQSKRFEETSPEPQALKDYAQRIGAERRNFRRYVVREQERERRLGLYHIDRYIITISVDGEVTIREARRGEVPDEIKPTAAEATAIKTACSDPNWCPKHIAAANTEALRAMVGEDATLFEFYDHKGEGIIFVQWRMVRGPGEKSDLPWTFWSDGVWRCMEPLETELPLFGLQHLKPEATNTVYVHEGAKTAWFLSQPDHKKAQWWQGRAWRDACPWAAELIAPGIVHLGWPGGAPNPHRVDWKPLQDLSPRIRVILVCDHDQAGENAASYISWVLQRRLYALRFGDEFPRRFDLSDPFPETLYELNRQGVRVYKRNAPKLANCIEPATWATYANERLRPEFIEEWLYSVQPALFVNRANFGRRYRESEFNALVAPFTHNHLPDVASLLRRYHSAQARTVVYEPDRTTGRITFAGEQAINAYQPSPIRPLAGDATPWLKFMEYLIPDLHDRGHLLRWCATLIARPDIHMKYGVLLISETQGTGKSTLGEILAELVGHSNTSFPPAETVVESRFKDWLAFKRLVVIAEVYMGHSAKAYNRLKEYVTDPNVRCEEKYITGYTIRNWAQFFTTSNSFRALKLDDQDRRWLVPGVTEDKETREYFRDLRTWLFEQGGLAIVAHWVARACQGAWLCRDR